MELSNLPIIDWELGIKLAGNKKDLAKEMLDLFIKDLSSETERLISLYKEQNYQDFQRKVHKLHSALCYCGLPRLKSIMVDLESSIKNNIMFILPSLLTQLEKEVNLLLDHYPNPSSQSRGIKRI